MALKEASLPWLTGPLAQFGQLLADQRVPHALLLHGPAGWGIDVLAAQIALRLLGLATDRKLEELAHPDFRRLQPDGAMIKIAQVRELGTFAVGTRQSAQAKVALLEDAHTMNGQAANALLKTLEEPTTGTYLLLASEYPGSLLPTIRSRCQSLALKPEQQAARQWLSSKVGNSNLLEDLSFEFGGAPLSVLAALEAELTPLRPALEASLATQRPESALEVLTVAPVEDVLVRWLRYLTATLGGAPGSLSALAGTPKQVLARFLEDVLALHRAVLGSNNVNVPLQLERLAYQFSRLPDIFCAGSQST